MAWEADFGTERDIEARAVEIASDGTPTLSIYWPVASTEEDEVKPAVGASASRQQYLVTWQQEVAHGEGYVWVSDAVVGRVAASDGTLQGSTFKEIGGYDAGWSAAAGGALGNYLVAFEDTVPMGSINVYGHMWGNRIYLPLVMRRS